MLMKIQSMTMGKRWTATLLVAVFAFFGASTSASAGADAPNPQDLLVVGPINIDLADDTSVPLNGLAGPHVLTTDTINTSYDVSLAASQLDIGLDVVGVDLTAVVSIVLTTDGVDPPCTLNGSPISLPVQ